jgi:4-amino-4-deoxy-L-arabinose transferase-like glycosyltransferase
MRWLAGIVLLALAVRLLAFAVFSPWEPQIEGKVLVNDSLGYYELALQLLEKRSFHDFDAGREAYRTPGYPLFIAAVYAVAGPAPWAVLLLQAFLDVGTLLLLYFFASRFFSPATALVAAGIYAIEPHAVLYSQLLVTEPLFVLLFLAALLAFVHAQEGRRAGGFALAGALLGLAVLVRPTAQFYALVLVLLVALRYRTRWRVRVTAAAAIVLAYAITVSPWYYRNYTEFGHASLSAQGGDFLLNWMAAYTEAVRSNRAVETVRADFASETEKRGYHEAKNPFDRSRIQTAVALEYLGRHPAYYVSQSVAGVVRTGANLETQLLSQMLGLEGTKLRVDFFTAPVTGTGTLTQFLRQKSPHEIAIGAGVAVFLLVLYSAALGGTWLCLKERRFDYPILAVATILYFCAFIGPIGAARYKLPMIPLYLPLAAYGLTAIYSRFQSRRTGPA